jgi:hypothetical protein
MERPEVRDVNSQLLLHEVAMEREMQLEAKERKRLSEMRKQMQFDEQYRRRYEEMLEYENQQLRARRAKAIAVAEEFKRQKAEKESEKRREKAEDQREEQILALQMQWEADQEREELLTARRQAMERLKENQRWNAEMLRQKEAMSDVEAAEEQRLRALESRIIDEEDERRAAELKRRNDKLALRQRLIDAETKRQLATKREQEDFLDRQIEQQFAKESKKVAEVTQRKRSAAAQRKRDYAQTMALSEQEKKEKWEKSRQKDVFTFDGNDPDVLELERRDRERKTARLDLQEFQRDQIQEKKVKDAAAREREILEEQHRFQMDRDFLERARQYATRKIQESEELEDENDRTLPRICCSECKRKNIIVDVSGMG